MFRRPSLTGYDVLSWFKKNMKDEYNNATKIIFIH